VSLKNSSGCEITRVTVVGRDQYDAAGDYVDASLKPHEATSVAAGNALQVWRGARSLIYQVEAVEFRDGKNWGKSFRPPPPPPPPGARPKVVKAEPIIVLPKLKLARKPEEELGRAVAAAVKPAFPRES
jgi:hypothetical protein